MRMESLRAGWREALVSMVAVLVTWYAAWRIERAAGLHLDVVVLATVLALTLSRAVSREGRVAPRQRLLRLLALPVIALAANEVGRLLANHRWLGGGTFVLVLSLAVWLRRFGPIWTRLGTLMSLPFLALLVVPVPIADGDSGGRTLWPALMAAIAFVTVALVRLLAARTGFLTPPAEVTPARRSRRSAVSTRMAAQLLVGLAMSYVLGRWLFPDHWPWLVISCCVVCSGNRGRGDVLHKGVLRLAGALVGTAAATLAASPFPAGDRTAIVLLFMVMAVALWLRAVSYAFWAMGTTAMLALFHGYFGIGGATELGDRLLGVLLGAVIGVAASWWVLPVRSTDVFRRRWADSLAALSDLLTALRETPADAGEPRATFGYAVAQLQQLEPAFRLHRRTIHQLLRPSDEVHPADLVGLLVGVRETLEAVAALPPETLAASRPLLGAWARQIGVCRRRMRGEDGEVIASPTTEEPRLAAADAAIAEVGIAFTTSIWRRLGGSIPLSASEVVTEVKEETGVVQPKTPGRRHSG